MDKSLCIITISNSYSNELVETVNSVENFVCKLNKKFSNICIGYFLVLSEGLSKLNKKKLYAIKNKNIKDFKLITGLDSGIYDAMNIGVNEAFKKNYSQILFINSGTRISKEINVRKFVNFFLANHDFVKFFAATEYISKSRRKNLIKPINPKKWIQHPYIMPTCHQSIIYPINLLKKYPFISFKGMLASDYIHLVYLIEINIKFISSDLLLTEYVNNGISSKKPYKSILQRYAGYYMIKGKLLKTIKLIVFWIIKTYLSKLIGLR